MLIPFPLIIIYSGQVLEAVLFHDGLAYGTGSGRFFLNDPVSFTYPIPPVMIKSLLTAHAIIKVVI
jgi:hypothetical protein